MLKLIPYLTFFLLLLPLVSAADATTDTIASAAIAYRDQSYAVAFDHLSNLAGLLEIAPIFDKVSGEERQKVLFDLARCRFAVGDSIGARIILRELAQSDRNQTSGTMDVPKDAAMVLVLSEMRLRRRRQLQAKISATSAFKAGIRSLVFPGWGQRYRGRKLRGNLFAAAAGAFALGWAVTDRSYRSALTAYRRTSELDLNLAARTGDADAPSPFADTFAKVESRASSARTMGAALVSVWVYSVTENFVIQPGKIALTIPLGW